MARGAVLAVLVALGCALAAFAGAQSPRAVSLAELAWRVDCGAVSLVQRGNRQEFVGLAAEETVGELRQAYFAMPVGSRPVWNVALFPSHPDYCRAVELARTSPSLDPAGFTVALRLLPGRTEVRSGDPLTFQVRATTPGYLYLDLLTRTNDAQSRAVLEHLIPREDPVNSNLNQRLTYSGQPVPFTVLSPGGGFHGWSAYLPDDVPRSVDLAIAIWVTRRPLDLVREGDVESDTTAYLRSLQPAGGGGGGAAGAGGVRAGGDHPDRAGAALTGAGWRLRRRSRGLILPLLREIRIQERSWAAISAISPATANARW